MLEQKMKIHKSLVSGSEMVLDRIEKKVRESSEISMHEMKCMVEIMGVVADVMKDLAKASYYEKDSPSTTL